ncbi:MAG: sulfotransferase domain-containing protein [Chloroflexi bacterium]|nr:sulfotransferase domain-containing protein [Chloroflexota bacterium]
MSIIWLASYPKSGNTWMRVFLTNYLRDADEPADINDLEKMGGASVHSLVEEYAGVESTELTADEIDLLRPDVYRALAAESEEVRFIKTHDAYTLLPDGSPLFPAEATRAAIYIVRNPLDVAVSMQHHMDDESLEQTIERMGDSGAVLAASVRRGNTQFRQKLLSWSDHVSSWLDIEKPFPVLPVRYEDMHAEPFATFARVVAFVGLPTDEMRLEKAIRFSRFDVLQRQEREKGFRERPRANARFFRRGRVGGWRDALSKAQAARIITDHRAMMNRLGYLPDGGKSPQADFQSPLLHAQFTIHPPGL